MAGCAPARVAPSVTSWNWSISLAATSRPEATSCSTATARPSRCSMAANRRNEVPPAMRNFAVFLLLAISALAAGLADTPARPRFTDVSSSSGLKIAAKIGVGGTNPHAVGIEDFDGDGLADIIILTFGKPH